MFNKNFKKFFIDHNAKTIESLKKINKLKGRSLIVVSNKIFLRGILSSADIRNAIMSHNITNEKINKIFNKKPKFIFADEIQKKINEISYNVKKFNLIPIIDRKTRKIVDVINLENLNLLNIKKNQKNSILVWL